MREYREAGLGKHKTAEGLCWRGRIIWRDGENDGWHHKSRVLTDDDGNKIPARPGKDDNRGKASAEKALRAWRESLIQADADAERKAAEEAESARIAAEQEAERARLEAQRVSVADYVDKYLNGLEALMSVEPSTMRHYRNTARLIRWEFADTMLQDLTRAMVQDFEVRIMSGEPYRCQPDGANRRPAGATTVRKVHTMLKTVCNHAMEIDELISRNPVSAIKPPEQPHPDKNAMDDISRARFTEYVATHIATPVVTGAALALWAGLGPGESCALRWRNVDLEAGTLRVDAAIGTGKGGDYEKEPKVKSRRRTVNMPAQLVEVLKRRRNVCVNECVAAGVPLPPSMYVLGDCTGAHYDPLLLSKQWSAIADAEGYTGTKQARVRLYDLRHTYATVLVANHVDIETVSHMMGHSNVAQTLNTYADSTPEAKKAAAKALEGAYGALPKVISFVPKTGTDGR